MARTVVDLYHDDRVLQNSLISPNPKKILGGGALASLLLALLAAAALDVVRGRIVERWQIERKLEIPIIAELHD